ncbi:MFS general substrate transporter [Microthyrium microscopicum]|uniref:MFS general substrate transporter n=1 Tax=Microthyrium microscopicum TaxID=703497 RepID=A0A6A6TVG6_9PEZI|nr:MFS general substrate transporter [Microthyrium microscopicum]
MTYLGITATPSQAATYFLCVCLFSISFLVFLNSAISFVITERIGQKKHVGDAVGTLGFADELLALFACPIWGVLSDRIGVRWVAVSGYTIVGLALVTVTFAKNVYPQLLLARLFFAIGGSATSTMVTAILPSMTQKSKPDPPTHTQSDPDFTPSISSELTITPARTLLSPPSSNIHDPQASSSRLAGYVGMATGLGALLALFLFLPLPAHLQAIGQSRSQAVASSFYIVASVALAVGIICIFGLANLPGEGPKSIGHIISRRSDLRGEHPPPTAYPALLVRAVALGFRDGDVGLAYVGGFVARASSVAISLFIPLYVNAYFIKSGRCPTSEPGAPPSVIKDECRTAYIVAAKLTGVSQLVALLCAPLFGYLGAHYRSSNAPLLVAAVAGLAGNAAFGRLTSPDPGEGGGVAIYLLVMMMGIGQIGAIVCSLGLLARGIHTEEEQVATGSGNGLHEAVDSEATPLIRPVGTTKKMSTRAYLKGSIAGVYSLAGGAGILLLTKVGGVLFDNVDPGIPFFIMAGFNGLLLLVGGASAFLNMLKRDRSVRGGLQHDSTIQE